jgi:hypothetical protein
LHDGPDTFRAVLFASDDLQNKYDGDFNQYFAVCLAEGRPPIADIVNLGRLPLSADCLPLKFH